MSTLRSGCHCRPRTKCALPSSGGLTTLYGFDDCVLRATGRHPETVSGNTDGLMVAGVYRQAQEAVLLRRLFLGNDTAEQRCRGRWLRYGQ